MRLAALALFAAAAAAQDSSYVFQRLWLNITAPAVSANVPNRGQASHVLTVLFPTATASVTEGLSVRIEASFDNVLWFPISRDVTTATYAPGTGALAIQKANASWPYIRARAVAAPAAPPMTAYYTGAGNPIGDISIEAGRIVTTPAQASYLTATWSVCSGAPCTTGTNLTNQYIVAANSAAVQCYAAAKTAPVGSALIVDVLRNGSISIFGPTQLVLPAGQTTANTSTFTAPTLTAGDRLTFDIVQIGSTAAGQDVTITCRLQTR